MEQMAADPSGNGDPMSALINRLLQADLEKEARMRTKSHQVRLSGQHRKEEARVGDDDDEDRASAELRAQMAEAELLEMVARDRRAAALRRRKVKKAKKTKKKKPTTTKQRARRDGVMHNTGGGGDGSGGNDDGGADGDADGHDNDGHHARDREETHSGLDDADHLLGKADDRDDSVDQRWERVGSRAARRREGKSRWRQERQQAGGTRDEGDDSKRPPTRAPSDLQRARPAGVAEQLNPVERGQRSSVDASHVSRNSDRTPSTLSQTTQPSPRYDHSITPTASGPPALLSSHFPPLPSCNPSECAHTGRDQALPPPPAPPPPSECTSVADLETHTQPTAPGNVGDRDTHTSLVEKSLDTSRTHTPPSELQPNQSLLDAVFDSVQRLREHEHNERKEAHQRSVSDEEDSTWSDIGQGGWIEEEDQRRGGEYISGNQRRKESVWGSRMTGSLWSETNEWDQSDLTMEKVLRMQARMEGIGEMSITQQLVVALNNQMNEHMNDVSRQMDSIITVLVALDTKVKHLEEKQTQFHSWLSAREKYKVPL